MAKKKVAGQVPRQQELADGEWKDKPPKPVQDAADAYDEALVALGEAKAEANTRKKFAIEKMEEHKVARVPIRDGHKFLVLTSKSNLKVEKPEKADSGLDDEEQEDDE